MKKTLLFLVLTLAVALSANAQRRHTVTRTYKSKHTYTTTAPRPRPRPRPGWKQQRYERYHDNIGEVRLHLGGELGFTDIGGLFMHELPHHYGLGAMAEVQTGRLLSLGLGADYYGTRGMEGSSFCTDDYLNCVPVYANVRLSTPGWRTRLFVEGKVGYAIPVNSVQLSRPYLDNVSAQGFYTGAGLGLSFFGNNISIGFNSIDLRDMDSEIHLLHNSGTADGMFTDFYLKYSYAIPLN